MSIVKLLEYEEGYRAKPYLCSAGYPTVGIGKKLGPQCSQEELEDLYQFELPYPVAAQWLMHDVQGITDQLRKHKVIGFAFNSCGLARQAILISMAYQMGIEGLAKFKQTIRYFELRQYDNAAYEMLDSEWYRNKHGGGTPKRALRHSEQVRSGQWLEEYRG